MNPILEKPFKRSDFWFLNRMIIFLGLMILPAFVYAGTNDVPCGSGVKMIMDNHGNIIKQCEDPVSVLKGKAVNPKAMYAPNRAIIEFYSEGPNILIPSAQDLLESKDQRKAMRGRNPHEAFDRLNENHHVARYKSLFRDRDHLDTVTAKNKEREVRTNNRNRFLKNPPPLKGDETSLVNFYTMEMVPPDNSPVDVETACQDFLSNEPHVKSCSPDYVMSASFVPNDPFYFAATPNFSAPFKKIAAEQAWDIAQGQDIIVAVVDSGVNYNHIDLKDNMWINPCEDLNNNGKVDTSDFNNKDDACAGQTDNLVDDIRGYNFATCNAMNNGSCVHTSLPNNDPMDHFGHGTSMASIIAAVGNNATQTIGVSWKAKIMPVKGLGDDGNGYGSDLSKAVKYAAEHGARIINNSYGPDVPRALSDAEIAAVKEANEVYHAVVIFAAGNKGIEDIHFYAPDKMGDVINVGASDSMDNHAIFSNYGSALDVVAPGVDIASLVLGSKPHYSCFRNITGHCFCFRLSRLNFVKVSRLHKRAGT